MSRTRHYPPHHAIIEEYVEANHPKDRESYVGKELLWLIADHDDGNRKPYSILFKGLVLPMRYPSTSFSSGVSRTPTEFGLRVSDREAEGLAPLPRPLRAALDNSTEYQDPPLSSLVIQVDGLIEGVPHIAADPPYYVGPGIIEKLSVVVESLKAIIE